MNRWLGGPLPWLVFAIALLVASVRGLAHAAHLLEPRLVDLLPLLIGDPAAALGAGWLATFMVLNGSIAAVVGLVLHDAGVVTSAGLLLVVLGSRMGASSMVLAMDLLSRLRRRPEPGAKTSLGMLSFLVTLSIYGPVAAVAVAIAGAQGLPTLAPGSIGSPAGGGRWAGAVFLASLLGLGASILILDHGIGKLDLAKLRSRVAPWLARPWRAAAIGMVATAATASTAFSVGALVPLYQRQVVHRREMIPYILGANVGTFADTILVAAILGSRGALVVIGVAAGTIGLVTVVALLGHRWYGAAVNAAQQGILDHPPLLVLVLLLLLATPLALVIL